MPTALERFMLQERQEGRKKLKAVIKNMLKKKMPISTISELTGLSEKEIKNLQTNE